MEKNKEKIRRIIVDTNVIISSLVKSEGITRAALLLLSKQSSVKLLTPKIFYQEIKFHLGEIARKTKLDTDILLLYLRELLKRFEIIDEVKFKKFMKQAKNLVKDEKDTSFVALALMFRPSIIMTYNKTDYKERELKKLNIKVKTPIETLKELGITIKLTETKLKRKKGLIKFFSKLMAIFRRKYLEFE